MEVPSVIVSEFRFGVFENMNNYKNAKSQLKNTSSNETFPIPDITISQK